MRPCVLPLMYIYRGASLSRRFGRRRIWQRLRRESMRVNHRRVYRLW
ncbi:IS3 family transposase [Enterobacter ludwigii]|nr:IS3 family transposase [Enterobacter ludwigii]